MEIRNKRAVITGAASGIGRAMAVKLAEEGADVVLADMDEDGLAVTRAEIEALGRRAVAVRTDVSKVSDVEEMYRRAIATMGRVDILVNNAGVHLSGRPEMLSIADWEWVMGINFWGVVYGVSVFLPHFLERGSGHIVNTSSIAGLIGWKDGSLPYTASKFAVVGLSEGLAVHLKSKGIGVTVVCPGLVMTNIGDHERRVASGDGYDEARDVLRRIFKEHSREELQQLASMEILTPEEVADQAIEAVKKDAFLVATHSETKEAMLHRATDMDGAIAEAAEHHSSQEERMAAFVDAIQNAPAHGQAN